MFVNGPQLNGRSGKGGGPLPQQRTQMLLEVRLRLRVGAHVAWPRHTQTGAEPPQVDPAELATDGAAKTLADPGGDGPPAPAVALGRGALCQRRHQLVLLRPTQERGAWSRLAPAVFDAVGAMLVVTPGDAAYPIRGIPRDAGN
jgi:hypothetical protein